jgi:hypothetical protein
MINAWDMTLDIQKKCELLAEEIASILKEGIQLSPDALHFIDSTYSNPSPQELANILEDESDCERDTLVEFIFFPDESIQIRLEDLLERLDLNDKEAESVIELLLQKERRTTVYYPDTTKPLIVRMPPSAVDPFLARLNISRKLDKELVDAIHKNVSENARTLVKVKLRNVRKIPVGPKLHFLSTYFEKMDVSDNDSIECLELVLDVLDDLNDNTEIFSGLMARKRFYFKSVLKADKFEAKLKKSNMEVLMLQGQRAPYIDKSDAIKKMALIDKVSLSVFGNTRSLDQVAAGIKLDGQNRADDLRKVIKLLTSY